MKRGCFSKRRYSSSSPVSWSSTAWAASRRRRATRSAMDSLTIVWDWKRRSRTRAAIESSIYLGGLRMGLGGGATIFRSTMGVWGDVTIKRGGGSWTVGGDSSISSFYSNNIPLRSAKSSSLGVAPAPAYRSTFQMTESGIG